MTRTRCRRSRTGIAPLEMVMSLPFLAGMAAMTFSLALVSLAKTTTVSQTRWKVWQLRAKPQSKSDDVQHQTYSPTSPLSAFEIAGGNTHSGRLSGETEEQVNIYQGLGGKQTTVSKLQLLTRTWDYRDITTFESDGPHIGVLANMGGIDLGPFGSLGFLTKGIPMSEEVASAGKAAEDELSEAWKYMLNPMNYL